MVRDVYAIQLHYIVARVIFRGLGRALIGVDERVRHSDMEGAARDLAKKLEEYCKENYWKWVEMRKIAPPTYPH